MMWADVVTHGRGLVLTPYGISRTLPFSISKESAANDSQAAKGL